MQVRLDYGKEGLLVEIPEDRLAGVLRLVHSPALPDTKSAIQKALDAPISTRPLAELARGRKNACIVLCDITRPVPNEQLLLAVLETLHSNGIPPEKVTLLIATGTHRPNEGDELVALVGQEIASRYQVVNHHSKVREEQTFLSVSPHGLPVWLDSEYCNADLKITIGLIEPHFMAGYSGGRKLIMPGIADFETIQRWHCPHFLESPMATNGIIEGNPVHEASLAVARMMPPDLILDVTLNEENEITGVFAGDLEAAWRSGTEVAARQVQVKVESAADIVVTTCAGYPLDATFYQAVKGMVGALPVVKEGGTIIIASRCEEGIGSPDFTRLLLETESLEAFMEHISQPDVFEPEEWQIEELAKVLRKARVLFVTDGIPAATLERCFVTPYTSVEEAIRISLAEHSDTAKILVIPRGPYLIPVVS